MKTNLILSLLLLNAALFGQKVLIDSVDSKILGKKVATTIILPDDFDAGKTYPVFYFLHSWGGSNTQYLSKETSFISLVKGKQYIIVTPSADTCWYINSHSAEKIKYEDFMSRELFTYIDKKYKTKKMQAIGGFSMGGYGALVIGLKNSKRFKFIADLSGAINPPFAGIPITDYMKPVMNSVRFTFGDPGSATCKGNDVFTLTKRVSASEKPFVFLAIGSKDEYEFLITKHKEYSKLLSQLKFQNQFTEIEAGHFTYKVVESALPEIFNRMDDTLK